MNNSNMLHNTTLLRLSTHFSKQRFVVGTPGPGYPLLLSLGKSLVVIVSYALTTEQPDPCGPEPYSPGKRSRTRSPLGKGPVVPRIPGVALS